MPEPGRISEDRGFKALITSYPVEAIEVFVPELLAERGRPAATVLQQESVLPDLADSSRFLDVAVLATWTDGSQAVILLVEHWSQAWKIDLRRVAWYVADLALRHPSAAVFPVILVTDPGAQAIPERWEMAAAGVTTLALRVRVYRVTAAELPRLRSLQNRVAAILTTFAVRDAVDAVVAALEHMARSPGPYDDLRRFLPFAVTCARMQASDRSRFRRRLEETGMKNVITLIEEEALAKGIAKGIAKGMTKGMTKGIAAGRAESLAETSRATVAAIHRLVENGILTRDAARAQLQLLIHTGAITAEIGTDALSQLP